MSNNCEGPTGGQPKSSPSHSRDAKGAHDRIILKLLQS
jgi:hypothetical protein